MDEANQTPIKEYKEFAITNNFRKMAEEIIGPFVKMYIIYKNRLQVKLSGVISENQQVKKKVNAMQQKLGKSKTFQRQMQQMKRSMEQLKIQNINSNKKTQTKLNNINEENQKTTILLLNLKQKLENNENSIKNLEQKNNKINQINTSISNHHYKTINQTQQKYINFTKTIIQTTSKLQKQYQQIAHLTNNLNQQFSLLKESQNQQFQPLQLYLTERNTINQQISQLKTKAMNFVTYFDFEGHTKSQKVSIDNFTLKIQNYIQKIFPKQLRQFFENIQQKLEQVNKIPQLQKNKQDTFKNIQTINNKIIQNKNITNQKIQNLNHQIKQQNKNVQQQIHSKIKQIQNKQITFVDGFNRKIKEVKAQVKNQVSEILESQFGKIKETLDDDKTYTRSKTNASQEELSKNVENIKKIQEKMSQKFIKIEELGQTIDFKIENYSSRITKIKSDFQLFSESMKKQMNGVSKFKVTFQEKLKGLGDLMSNFAEIMMINTSINIQKYQEQFIQTVPYENKQQVVFVTENDGIIYEWKPENPKGIITYRRKQMDTRQFLLSTMYSFITLVDEKLKEQQFLFWQKNKPSQFFTNNVFTNYKISQKKITNYKNQIIKNFYRSHTFRSNHIKPNNSSQVPLQNQQMNQSIDYSIKQFSKTIDTSAKVSHPVEQGNYLNFSSDTRRQFSLKRQNLSSENPKSKVIKDKEETQRYNDPFFTSRSACRSRISQAL